MSDLVQRMRSALQRGKDTRQLAVPIDLDDLEMLIALGEDGELLGLLDDAHASLEAITMDDPDGEPTRLLWCVEGADASCIMPLASEAIARAHEKGQLHERGEVTT